MRIFKRIAAGLIAAATMASLSISAFAESWSIDYTRGAPSSVSTQFVRKTQLGFTGSFVSIDCYSVSKGGKIEVIGTGFDPYGSAFFEQGSTTRSCKFYKPSPVECTVEIWARTDRVVANGQILWVG